MAVRRSGRIIFVDPSLGLSGGHHAGVAANYVTMTQHTGRTIVVAGNRRGQGGHRRLFDHATQDAFRVSLTGQAWMAHLPLARLARAAKRALFRPDASVSAPKARAALSAEACSALLTPLGAEKALNELFRRVKVSPEDDVVVLSADPALLAALYRRRAEWLGPGFARWHIIFMFAEAQLFGPATEAGFRQIYRSLAAAQTPPEFYAESQAHASALNTWIDAPVKVVVTPVRTKPVSPPSRSAPFTISVLGAARRDKGYHRLPSIVRSTHSAAPDHVFRIQGPAPDAGLDAVTDELAAMANVTILPPALDEIAYEAELTRTHVLLLPYDTTSFLHRGSGVAVDALVAGRPLVCSKGSALAGSIAAGNGLAADTDADFAHALNEVCTAYDRFAKAAQRHSTAALQEITNSALVRALSA